jgi:hypothetical protein
MSITFNIGGFLVGYTACDIVGSQQNGAPSCWPTWIFDTGTIGIGNYTLRTKR